MGVGPFRRLAQRALTLNGSGARATPLVHQTESRVAFI
jgi:hypothetical protein